MFASRQLYNIFNGPKDNQNCDKDDKTCILIFECEKHEKGDNDNQYKCDIYNGAAFHWLPLFVCDVSTCAYTERDNE